MLARRLRWQLGGRIESEVRVVLGPPRKTVQRIQEEVLRSRRLVAEAKEIERAEKLTAQQIEKRARVALREIAADPKPWMFGFAQPIMSWVFRKIFDGIDVDVQGLEKVRAAARKGPLVIVPSHKSHIDYLVLSYVFLTHDLVPPLVAAGANLSFWPLGFFFRRGGAFFLRRTFKGDKLYGAVFRAYVRKMLRESFNIEFFIEGGRSRTGKLLAPKLGLLGMVVEAALDDDGAHARKAQIVPISIGYEKVIEEKSYAKEAAGGEKKKEDVAGLLKATRVLGAQYGRLNIQFDDPMPLGETLREYGALAAWDEEANIVVAAEEAQWKQATQRLAHRIVYGIDRVTAVTATALAASALLASGKRGIVRQELLAQARFLIERARANQGRLSAALVDDSGGLDTEALDRAIELLARDGDLEVRSSARVRRLRRQERPADGRDLHGARRSSAAARLLSQQRDPLLRRRGPGGAGAARREQARPRQRRGIAAAHAQAVAPAQARVQLSRRRDLRGHLRFGRSPGSRKRASSRRRRTACIRRPARRRGWRCSPGRSPTSSSRTSSPRALSSR